MKQLVSIVVPVYNAEKNLRKCIDSLLAQTYEEIEIILVDDESKDSSLNICEEYAERESRITVIRQKNAGCGEARNTGISNSNGAYVATVDSDDWVEPSYIETMMSVVEHNPNIDYVKCGFFYVNEDKITGTESWKEGVIPSEERMKNIQKGIFWIVVWNALYKRELALRVKQPGIIGQDNYASFFYMLYAQNIAVVSKPLYYYWSNPQGVTKDPRKQVKRRFDLLTNTEMILETLQQDDTLVDHNTMEWLQKKWAKEWYHYVREDKKVKSLQNDKCRQIAARLDYRRRMSFYLVLLCRKIFS